MKIIKTIVKQTIVFFFLDYFIVNFILFSLMFKSDGIIY
ncbi:hypothetical protein J2746_001213 [Methanolobus bombayensis]|nr:hypothetical protein [Methanolobus bombayensis]